MWSAVTHESYEIIYLVFCCFSYQRFKVLEVWDMMVILQIFWPMVVFVYGFAKASFIALSPCLPHVLYLLFYRWRASAMEASSREKLVFLYKFSQRFWWMNPSLEQGIDYLHLSPQYPYCLAHTNFTSWDYGPIKVYVCKIKTINYRFLSLQPS